ncbi:MAG TPA: ABC transporter substrate-binding protein [Candidatus Polarisedimenticolia bacterium]|nr:ABC transporter substrate-binding protein [Candidatus Polarisedimenticolia bacterium]
MDGGRHGAKAAWLVAASIAFLALALPGCLSRPKEPLRIGVNAWPPFELLYLARSRGYFEAEHVDVDLVDFSTYTGILKSYHRGNIDGFLATLNEVQIADNFQDPPAVVLVVDYSFGGDALVVSDGIGDLKGLRGKRIAYEESALGSYELERILEIGGLAPGEIKAVSRLPAEAEEDFRKGTVQGVITYEPSLGRLLHHRGARVLFSSREIPGEIVDVMAMRRSVLDGRAEEMRRALRAWFRAVEDLREHPEEVAAQMARQRHATIEEYVRGLQGARIPDLSENRALLGRGPSPGTLHATSDRLAEFLLRHRLTGKALSGPELIRSDLLDAM